MKQAHTPKDVAKLLNLDLEATEALVRTVFGEPRDVLSFQDLVLLRTAHRLATSKVPKRRIVEEIGRAHV